MGSMLWPACLTDVLAQHVARVLRAKVVVPYLCRYAAGTGEFSKECWAKVHAVVM